jgi:hypothetical protein
MGRLAPPDPAVYEKLEAVLRMIEETGTAIVAEHGVKVRIEHNRPETNRGGKFPYITFRGVGLEDEPFGCSVCHEPATMLVTVGGEDVPRCDEHEDELAGMAA